MMPFGRTSWEPSAARARVCEREANMTTAGGKTRGKREMPRWYGTVQYSPVPYSRGPVSLSSHARELPLYILYTVLHSTSVPDHPFHVPPSGETAPLYKTYCTGLDSTGQDSPVHPASRPPNGLTRLRSYAATASGKRGVSVCLANSRIGVRGARDLP
jgi:hypothetical protein